MLGITDVLGPIDPTKDGEEDKTMLGSEVGLSLVIELGFVLGTALGIVDRTSDDTILGDELGPSLSNSDGTREIEGDSVMDLPFTR